VTVLLEHLRGRVESGAKLLVPYIMSGLPDRSSFSDAFVAVARHADVVELGLPYSDPLMDGPVIAAAGERAIRAGIGPLMALDLAGELPSGVLRVAMTYYNPIHRTGEREFCRRAAQAGISGLIVPDIPVEESDDLRAAAADHGLAWIPLVAPTSSPERVETISATATGFVYAVSTLGVTGTRTSLSERASGVVAACREATDLPVLVGIGVSNAAQAVEAAADADGVVVGSAVVSTLLGSGAQAAEDLLGELRSALDEMSR
jgi:tryptophan synthase alpha chain